MAKSRGSLGVAANVLAHCGGSGGTGLTSFLLAFFLLLKHAFRIHVTLPYSVIT